MSVDPSAGMQGETTAEHFLVDVGASGATGARRGKHLCLGSVLEDADIEATQTRGPSANEPGLGSTTIASDSLSASFTVAGAGSGLDGVARNRWFFVNEAGDTDYYDSASR